MFQTDRARRSEVRSWIAIPLHKASDGAQACRASAVLAEAVKAVGEQATRQAH